MTIVAYTRCLCIALPAVLVESFKFKPTRKMRVLNWTKLQQNTIKKNQLALWKKEATATDSLTINGDQIVELFSQAEIVPKTKKTQAKKTSVVRQQNH